ncbi:cysteine-rich receptor-like protein kinase 2 isoform X2 [Amborella trichopoda]|nr:cysteine-rich receptor-like protein kinase 2 isoform X2 [Amborella trichopoda]|eukprot:XP_006847936.2 cysteine-rich receptor-like protein kinase 2 isoform X2 [Amborella trichopoda]
MKTKSTGLDTLLFTLLSIGFLSNDPVMADPETNLLNKGCSQYNVTNSAVFFENLNASFTEIRNQLRTKSFATAEQVKGSDPAYAMAQCRDYLSTSDCLACFSVAEAQIRNCSSANGARVIYDGCFLRYESSTFFDQATLPGNVPICGNKTSLQQATFTTLANDLLRDLSTAASKIPGYFGAVVRNGSDGLVAYGVAQCAQTVAQGSCESCLSVAYTNIDGCLPDTDGRAVDAGCFMRYSANAFFNESQATDLTPFLSKGSSSKKWIIGVVVGAVAGLILLVLLVYGLHRLRRRSRDTKKRDILGATELRGPVSFHYKDLKSATSNFSEVNKLGEGGFGDVYKGILKNGKTVAVKKLTIGQSSRAKANFEGEVKLISNVHHRNLIRLLGCCGKGPNFLLVYEYMANGSLDKYLFGEEHGKLNWKMRFDIIVGMARGLAYLHDEFHVRIIHRDIKSSNILLDDDFQPKLADFGLARLLPEDHSHLTTRFAGTLGYTAPEYAIHGQLSEKVDTYSFGVVVLEIISGRKSNDIKLEPITQYLLEWAWKLYESNMLMELVDDSLDPSEYNPEDIKRVIEIALTCTQSLVASRPTMSEVVVLLLSKGPSGPKPAKPTFIDSATRVRGDTSSSSSSAPSNATVSVSLTAR